MAVSLLFRWKQAHETISHGNKPVSAKPVIIRTYHGQGPKRLSEISFLLLTILVDCIRVENM